MALAVKPANTDQLIVGLTAALDGDRLGFPREVADELMATVHTTTPPPHPIWAWAGGLTTKLKPYEGEIGQKRPLMGHIVDLGFDHGPESLDNKEPCLVRVGCLCLDLCDTGRDFFLATEDVGEHPLRPTMGQVAEKCGWPVLDAVGALSHLDLDHLI